MIKSKLFMTTVALLVLGVTACSSPAEQAKEEAVELRQDSIESASESISESADFAASAVSANLFEIQSSQLALERSKTPAVRALAERIIAEHTKANTALMVALKTSGATAPIEVLLQAHQNKLNDLKNASVDDFDKKYIDTQKDAHKDTIKVFEDYVKNEAEGPVKDFARKTISTLNAHLVEVEKLSK
jgi:putative membrane protein